MSRSTAPRAGRLARATHRVALATALAAVGALAAAADGPLPVPGKPSIPAGAEVFAAACAACHGDDEALDGPGWRRDLAPADVARLALGQAAAGLDDHVAAVDDAGAAWAATAYLWTRSMTGRDVRRGEKLALEAEDQMKRDALGTALFHWRQIQDLRDGRWVLNHTQADVGNAMGGVAGKRYTSLSEADRRALIDYIFASYFTWPDAW